MYPGDEVATAPDGGRTISCTKGEYWTDHGVAPCSDNSSDKINFVNVDGTTINTSSRIIRGFKPGYTISNTSGIALNNGGQGGNGATGGSGGISGSGGGGGSGYSSGDAKVLTSTLGGGLGNSRFVISVNSVDSILMISEEFLSFLQPIIQFQMIYLRLQVLLILVIKCIDDAR